MKSLHGLALGTCAALALAGGAIAGTIYTNGPYNGTINAWNITGFTVADSFSVGSSGLAANGALFDTLDENSNPISSINWEIATGTPGSFTSVANGTATVGLGTLTSTFIDVNATFDFQHYQNTISFGNVDLTSGTTYWLLLTGADVGPGGGAFWDEDDGPSAAWESATGTIGSEDFEILGGAATGTPEPAIWALMLTGIAGLGAALRTRRRIVTA